MTRAFEALFGVANAFAGISMPGRTDSWLLSRALEAQGIPLDDPRVDRFCDTYLPLLARELDAAPPPSTPKGILPGIRALLDALAARDDTYLGLLTGNFEPAARLKLEHFDLWRYFGCGAFGDRAADRNSLLAEALARIEACGGPIVSPQHAIVIGDTPLDVAVAKSGGARSIAVATGSHTADALRASGADYVFDDLSDVAMVMRALAGGSRMNAQV